MGIWCHFVRATKIIKCVYVCSMVDKKFHHPSKYQHDYQMKGMLYRSYKKTNVNMKFVSWTQIEAVWNQNGTQKYGKWEWNCTIVWIIVDTLHLELLPRNLFLIEKIRDIYRISTILNKINMTQNAVKVELPSFDPSEWS